ncbi:MAG: DUF5678 domain-containing protein [Chloroflexota bacterium]
MALVELRPNLIERLTKEADRRRKSVEELVNEWLEDQLWQDWHRKISEETNQYQEQHAELLKKYRGQCVAMRDGKVIDHDSDLPTLHRRVRDKYGDEPILMSPVSPIPLPTFKVRSPKRKRVNA